MKPLPKVGARPRPVAICIPARNEALHIPALIRSLALQRLHPNAVPVRVIVVANNCTDETVPVLEALKRDYAGGGMDMDIVDVRLDAAQAHVGFARRMAMDRGALWLERQGGSDGVLMTTDADAIAPPDWVTANLAALEHAELVGGRLRMAPDDATDASLADLHQRIERYWSSVRALEQAIDPPSHDPDPRHGDHTAASLALPVSVYRQAGGMPTLACGEDNALVTQVGCLGGRVRHCPKVEIVVSPRRAGRVEGGMATEMRRRAAIAAERRRYELPPADHWRRLFERRAALRQAWVAVPRQKRRSARFDCLGLSAEDIAAISPATCPNDIAFVERAMQRESQRTDASPPIDLDLAISQIDDLLRTAADASPHGRP